ncbi:MAG TPA: hypothetical protein VJ276_19705 [Thermoanaerobaculia bacterium]|nr:hypothetical protein [Thermoanaerobaculia bacterium]
MIGTLFYDASRFAAPRIADIAAEMASSLSSISFAAPGDVVERALGVPFLAGMDDIAVRAAELELTVDPTMIEPKKSEMSALGFGVVIDLTNESRLKEIELTAESILPLDHHLVIRSAVKNGSSYTAGPPIYVHPPFDGGMFGPLLGGISMDGQTAKFPAVSGIAFVVEFATGSTPTALVAQKVPLGVASFSLERVPRDLTVTLAAGGADLPVWSHPGVLLPGSQAQSISFRPMAERLLAQRLGAATGAGTLAVTLRFRSASVGRINITSPRLEVTYHATPANQPLQASLRGSWETIELEAPASLRPDASSVRVTANYLGRMLNAASATPDAAPTSGLRIDVARSVAARAPYAGSNPLASVRMFAAVMQPSEIAVELRANAAGGMGVSLGPQTVRQLDAPFLGWIEIELPAALPLAGADAVWIAVRATKGEVVWCCDAGDAVPALVRSDPQGGWSAPPAALAPRIMLFEAAADPPQIEVRVGPNDSWILPRSSKYTTTTSLPPFVHKLLLAGRGGKGGRARSAVRLFSTAAVDLKLDAIDLSYDPS